MVYIWHGMGKELGKPGSYSRRHRRRRHASSSQSASQQAVQVYTS